MKKLTKFLSIFAIVAIFLPVIACSNDDEPPYDPTKDPSYNDTVIYIEDIDENNDILGKLGFMSLSRDDFDGYRVIIKRIFTMDLIEYSYTIHIPAEGVDMRLKNDGLHWWMKVPSKNVVINNQKVELFEEKLGYYSENDSERYYYRRYNEYIELSHTTKDEINVHIEPNDSKVEKTYYFNITNGHVSGTQADIYFIQEGKT